MTVCPFCVKNAFNDSSLVPYDRLPTYNLLFMSPLPTYGRVDGSTVSCRYEPAASFWNQMGPGPGAGVRGGK
jgi:hypothetical protein